MASTQTNYRPLGTTPGNEHLARESQRVRQEFDGRIAAREVHRATLPSSGSVEIRHGLRSVPQAVTVTCTQQPVRTAVTARNTTIVTITNGDATATTIEVVLY
jgi:hypothetical protein